MGERRPIEAHGVEMHDKRVAELARILAAHHPELSKESVGRFAEQVTEVLDRSADAKYDLSETTLLVKGSKRTSIGDLLKKLREAAHLRQEDVVRETMWHPAKVSRIESGHVPVAHIDLLFLLQLYRVRDQTTIQQAISLAQQDRARRSPQRGNRGKVA